MRAMSGCCPVFVSPEVFAERVGSRSADRTVRHKRVIEKNKSRMRKAPSNLRIVHESKEEDDDEDDVDLAPRRLELRLEAVEQEESGTENEDDDLCLPLQQKVQWFRL